MNRARVESSNLESVGYENSTLEVEFKSGSIYQYFDVPSVAYNGLRSAVSKGEYFNAKIRGKYKEKKIR